jgi:hypothetical protein
MNKCCNEYRDRGGIVEEICRRGSRGGGGSGRD